uniref:Protein S100 n=1 Tax=Nothoprocta perdicaria TaxID=30464 RepID=A0A8C7A5B2_NOTPE
LFKLSPEAMDTLISIFHQYSGKEGDRYKLNKEELKELLASELTDFLSGQKDPLLIDKIMKDLDSNNDNEVDFNEFVILVACKPSSAKLLLLQDPYGSDRQLV